LCVLQTSQPLFFFFFIAKKQNKTKDMNKSLENKVSIFNFKENKVILLHPEK
jgi:hypothetical protein